MTIVNRRDWDHGKHWALKVVAQILGIPDVRLSGACSQEFPWYSTRGREAASQEGEAWGFID